MILFMSSQQRSTRCSDFCVASSNGLPKSSLTFPSTPFTGVRSSWVTLATNSDFTLAAWSASSRIRSTSLLRNSFSNISLAMHMYSSKSVLFLIILASTGKQVWFLRYATKLHKSFPSISSAASASFPGKNVLGKTSLICLPHKSCPYSSFSLADAFT